MNHVTLYFVSFYHQHSLHHINISLRLCQLETLSVDQSMIERLIRAEMEISVMLKERTDTLKNVEDKLDITLSVIIQRQF